MSAKSIKKIKKLKGVRVLLHLDLNVPLDRRGRISDNSKIVNNLNTLKYLYQRGAIVTIITHLGRPMGKEEAHLSTKKLAGVVSKKIKKSVIFLGMALDPKNLVKINKSEHGTVLMLENIRFYTEEMSGDNVFAKKLSLLGDIFVNDAFAVSHRDHASITKIQKFLPSYVGFLVEKEYRVLKRFLSHPRRPYLVLMGGAKLSTKLKLIKAFKGKADHILLGGGLANTVLTAEGYKIGKSLIEKKMVKDFKGLSLLDNKIKIPVDVVVCRIGSAGFINKRITAVAKVKKDEIILDIGPDTVFLYRQIIRQAKTIVWNGPMGLFEKKEFSRGTKLLAKEILNSHAQVMIGGGETVEAVRQIWKKDKIKNNIYISTAGGAMLEFLKKGTLVGIKNLIK